MSRDNYGAGALRLRGGTYHYDLMVDGTRLRGSTGKSTQRAAQTVLQELIAKKSHGTLSPATEKHTIPAVVAYFLTHKTDLKPKTRTNYTTIFNDQIVKFFGSGAVKDLTADDFVAYRKYRSLQPKQTAQNSLKAGQVKTKEISLQKHPGYVSQLSINRELASFRSALNFYKTMKPGSIGDLPKMLMVDERKFTRQGFITEEDLFSKFYPATPRHLAAFITCAFYLGGRLAEWLNLEWSQIDFDAGVLHFKETKNQVPREVPMLDQVRHALTRQREYVEATWPGCPFVFTYDGRTPLRHIKRSFRTLARKAGFPDIRPHDLRRSANKWMRKKGFDQALRKQIMGHKTNSMDERYGSMKEPGDIDRAIELARKK